MRKLIVSEFLSLDGVMQAPGGADEDTEGGFRHGGWSMPYFDPEAMGSSIDEVAQQTDVLLYGRRTWQVTVSTSGLPVPRHGCRSTAPDTDCARSTPTSPGTTSCARRRSATVARPSTPTPRRTRGCSSTSCDHPDKPPPRLYRSRGRGSSGQLQPLVLPHPSQT